MSFQTMMRSALVVLALTGTLAIGADNAGAGNAALAPAAPAASATAELELAQARTRRCWTRRRCHYPIQSNFPRRRWHTDIVRCCYGFVPGRPTCSVIRHYRDIHFGRCPYPNSGVPIRRSAQAAPSVAPR